MARSLPAPPPSPFSAYAGGSRSYGGLTRSFREWRWPRQSVAGATGPIKKRSERQLLFPGGSGSTLIDGPAAVGVLWLRWRRPCLWWTDAVVPGLAQPQATGRWGNWANQEAFGTPTSVPWGLWIDPDRQPAQFASNERFHPTFLYES